MKNKKKTILIIIIVLIIAIAGIIYFVYKNIKKEEAPNDNEIETNQDDHPLIDMSNTENINIIEGEKQNNSVHILSERRYEGLLITEVQLATENGISKFSAKVVNDTETDFSGKIVILNFFGEDGFCFADMEAYIPEIKAGRTNYINAATTADIVNAYDYIIE